MRFSTKGRRMCCRAGGEGQRATSGNNIRTMGLWEQVLGPQARQRAGHDGWAY